MDPERPPTRLPPYRRRAALCVWMVVFLGVGITTGRLHVRGDATQMCAVAHSLTDHGWFDIPRLRSDVPVAHDGKRYSKYPLATVLQCVPALGLRNLGRWLDAEGSATEYLLTGVVPAAVTATVALFFFLVLLELGFTLGTAAFAAFVVVFTTPIWAYGRELYSENLTAAVLLATLWAVLAAERTRSRRWLLAVGALCGLMALVKLPLAVLPAIVALVFAVQDEPLKRWRQLVVYGVLGGLPFAAAFLAYNYVRYGGVLELGYGENRDGALGFSTPMYSGLHGLLFSSGKSVFLYAPLVAVGLLGLRAMWRRHRGAVVYIVVSSVFLFLIMSKWWSGLGDWGWGPRLVVPVIPLLVVPAAYALYNWNGWKRVAVWGAATAGLAINFLGVIIDHSHYLTLVSQVTRNGLRLHEAGGFVRDDLVIVHFVPEFSPPLGHLWLFDIYYGEWHAEHWIPWRALNVPAWRITGDPTPPALNHWSDGSPEAWAVTISAWVLIALFSILLLHLARRALGQR